MATKATSKTSTKISAEKAPKAVVPAPAAKPRTSRVTSAKHSKTVTPEVLAEVLALAVPAPAVPVAVITTPTENKQEVIAKIAYGYWEARGYQAGDSIQDWLRAEAEYASRF